MYTQIENPENKENNRNIANRPVVQKKKNVITKKLFANMPIKKKPKCRSVTNSNESTVYKYIKVQQKTRKVTPKKVIQPPKPKINIKEYYTNKENSLLFTNYGVTMYSYLKKDDIANRIPANFLSSHQIKKDVHTKMIDWMIEVLTVYESTDETFFLAVKVFNFFLSKSTEVVKTEDIHLLGITSMFIASKFEDMYPISLKHFSDSISHKLFKRATIVKQEKKIINTIGYESVVTVSIYDFLKTFFSDFTQNNREAIKEAKCEELVEEMRSITLYIAKMIVHFDYFYSYSDCANAIGCLMKALSVLKDRSTRLNTEQDKILFDWVQYVMKESEYTPDILVDVYLKISDCYEKFNSNNTFSQNQKKFCPLTIK